MNSWAVTFHIESSQCCKMHAQLKSIFWNRGEEPMACCPSAAIVDI